MFITKEYKDEEDTTQPSCSIRNQDDDKVVEEVENVVFIPPGPLGGMMKEGGGQGGIFTGNLGTGFPRNVQA